jgi:hypothetical protein
MPTLDESRHIDSITYSLFLCLTNEGVFLFILFNVELYRRIYMQGELERFTSKRPWPISRHSLWSIEGIRAVTERTEAAQTRGTVS